MDLLTSQSEYDAPRPLPAPGVRQPDDLESGAARGAHGLAQIDPPAVPARLVAQASAAAASA